MSDTGGLLPLYFDVKINFKETFPQNEHVDVFVGVCPFNSCTHDTYTTFYLFLSFPKGSFIILNVYSCHHDVTNYDNWICVRVQSTKQCKQSGHGLEQQHPPPPGFPEASKCPFSTHRRRAAGRRCESGQMCSSLVQRGLSKQQQQQQSPVLYSPTSALQNACCG